MTEKPLPPTTREQARKLSQDAMAKFLATGGQVQQLASKTPKKR